MIRIILTTLLIGLLSIPFQVFARSIHDGTKTSSVPQIIKLQRFRKALWKVHVTVKGKEGDFLFDTGGGMTHVTKEFADGLECRFWGRTTGYNMFGHRAGGPHCDEVQIDAGGVGLIPVSVGFLDFGDQFAGDKTPDGLLALDAFDGKAITIDQKEATVTIETPASLAKRVRSMQEFPLRVARECSGRCLSAFLGVKTPDGMTWLNIDTGAGGVSLFSKEYAPSFGLDPDKKEQSIDFALNRDVRIGGQAMIADMIMDGNLGQPFLSKYIVTIDLKNSRIWFGERR